MACNLKALPRVDYDPCILACPDPYIKNQINGKIKWLKNYLTLNKVPGGLHTLLQNKLRLYNIIRITTPVPVIYPIWCSDRTVVEK